MRSLQCTGHSWRRREQLMRRPVLPLLTLDDQLAVEIVADRCHLSQTSEVAAVCRGAMLLAGWPVGRVVCGCAGGALAPSRRACTGASWRLLATTASKCQVASRPGAGSRRARRRF